MHDKEILETLQRIEKLLIQLCNNTRKDVTLHRVISEQEAKAIREQCMKDAGGARYGEAGGGGRGFAKSSPQRTATRPIERSS